MRRRRCLTTLASVIGTLVLSVGVAACGAGSGGGASSSSSTASTATTATVTTTTTASGTVPTAGANPGGATSPAAGTTGPASTKPSGGGGLTTGTSSTGSGSGSGSGSGGAGLGSGDATTSTSTTCTGHDCQGSGAPLAPGAIKPNGKSCPSGYIYLPPQDGGPALCIPVASSGTATAGGADFHREFPDGILTVRSNGSEITGGFGGSPTPLDRPDADIS
jgi:hypothetical protein